MKKDVVLISAPISQDLSDAILVLVTDAVIVVGSNGRVVRMSHEARRLVESVKDSGIGSPVGSLLPGIHLPLADEEIIIRHADGSPLRLRVLGSTVMGVDEEPLYVLCLREVATPDLVLANGETGIDWQRSAAILDGISRYQTEMICRFLPDTKITYANDAYAGAFALTVEDVVGRRIVDFVPRAGQEDLAKYFGSFTPDQPERYYEHELVLAGERPAWTCWTDRAFFGDDGQIIEFQSIGRDLTELRDAYLQLKRSESVLRGAKDAAETASRAKSAFIANASHEVRTPLNVIIGFSEILKSEMIGALGNPRYLEYARIIYESGHYLLTLINDVLDLSKIEAGKYQISPEMIALPPIVEMVTTLISDQVARTRLTLSVVMPPSVPQIYADDRAVKQVLLNLLSNAIKFTPAGGSITISVEINDVFVVVSIIDTGIGIPAGDIDRVVQPYERLESPLAREQPGTGIGLTLTKSLVGLHGGSLTLQSEEGVGTSVTVTFPRLCPEECEIESV